MADLSKKRIIMIHGLASKPPEADLHTLWSRCLIENIRVENKGLAKDLEDHPEALVHAYWADATPHHIPDEKRYTTKLSAQVDKVIAERKKAKERFHVGRGERFASFFKSRALDVVNVFSRALTIKDDVMKNYLAETKLYDEDQYVADQMRKRLEEELISAWDDGCDVTILSHSMGTFISYDVLWRFSHRATEPWKKYRNKRVQMFVTMGSPLADSEIRGMLFAKVHREKGKRGFPTNIDRWHNYACLGDVVSHEHDFEGDFFKEMKELKLLPKKPKHHAIDYANLHNPFEVVTHPGNKNSEKRNPHKSYGYLVQPRLGSWVSDFLLGRLR
ncbi:MAG: hypothetical protein ACI8X5_002863 [Planctomycetota bacterium]|jgi:hypothetical protein